ncbi:Pirin-like protein [Shewanella piezotolerans WP3]|uniref:Pirin-like protein n=1 Tax=Shewanella piezotolerans (strain WP3 / JCM 13877) TaxID=225849 RepID=B8CRL6_SHEPW|nr:pirin family protein [Shewanella piezotolerans]ACJ30024.1 Pirin-like protein [Shewanella piezotolerans WP3]
MKILNFSDMPKGGFAGLRERQLVIDPKINYGREHSTATKGIGNFVYMADANFLPKGETGMHPHHEVDVISVMIDGRINHAGSLKHGQQLNVGLVQVQRAGAEGFSHNEINPDDKENNMIQLWVLPETPGERADYKVYQPKDGERLRVYGGDRKQNETFSSDTQIDIARPFAGETLIHKGKVMAYLVKGRAVINGKAVQSRTLIEDDGLVIQTETDCKIIFIYTV